MKPISISIWAILLTVATSTKFLKENEEEEINRVTRLRQKFLFKIVYRVQDPLLFPEYLNLGEILITDETLYTTFTEEMMEFQTSLVNGELLPRGVFFSSYSPTHMRQALGLFQHFVNAKNWEVFTQNCCWARTHVSEGVFIHALTLAISNRNDCSSLFLPMIYEIFPQHFFHSGFLYQAEKFNYQMWTRRTNVERNLNAKSKKTCKIWQWWKMMGFENKFYIEEMYPIRDDIDERLKSQNYIAIMKDLKIFWMPIDYTRDVEIFNDMSKISYLSEDLDWNAFWYYLNLKNSFHLTNDNGELWFFNIQQILARYYMECLSHGLGAIEKISYRNDYKTGYNPQVITYSGIGFNYRKNNWSIGTYGNSDLLEKIQIFENHLIDLVDNSQIYKMNNRTKIDLNNQMELIEWIVDAIRHKSESWLTLSHLYMSTITVIESMELMPHSLLNYETTLRDPLAYSIYQNVVDIYLSFKEHLNPYSREELVFADFIIENVSVDRLETFFDLVDFDVSNLLSDRVKFNDNGDANEFIWDQMLLARQMRLNHKPFSYDIRVTSKSTKSQLIVVRCFLGPKYDEFGRRFTSLSNGYHKNFIELDKFLIELILGENHIHRNSIDFHWTVNDRTTFTEYYHFLMSAGNAGDVPPKCGFPNRLILPRGWPNGMPMEMIFILAPFNGEKLASDRLEYSCGIGSGIRQDFDNRSLGYPFDRPIEEANLLAPNIFSVDVKIYHNEVLSLPKVWNTTGKHKWFYEDDKAEEVDQ